jgi:hypothetical protein
MDSQQRSEVAVCDVLVYGFMTSRASEISEAMLTVKAVSIVNLHMKTGVMVLCALL